MFAGSAKIRAALFTVLAAVLVSGCLTVDDENATATAEAGGVDRDYLVSEATRSAGDFIYDNRLLAADATSTAAAGGHDSRLANADASATAERQEFLREYDLTSTAYAVESDATSTAVSIAIASGTPQADRLAPSRPGTGPSTLSKVVPAPTPTSQSVLEGPWLTAFQAVEIASSSQRGTVKNVIGHVAKSAGQTDSGDVTARTPSPAGGYSALWEVTIEHGTDLLLCTVRSNSVSCDTLRHATEGDISDAHIDSPDVLKIWADNADWNELLRNEKISILMALQPDPLEPEVLMWQCSVTVHNQTDGLRGGNFLWTPSTNAKSHTTY